MSTYEGAPEPQLPQRYTPREVSKEQEALTRIQQRISQHKSLQLDPLAAFASSPDIDSINVVSIRDTEYVIGRGRSSGLRANAWYAFKEGTGEINQIGVGDRLDLKTFSHLGLIGVVSRADRGHDTQINLFDPAAGKSVFKDTFHQCAVFGSDEPKILSTALPNAFVVLPGGTNTDSGSVQVLFAGDSPELCRAVPLGIHWKRERGEEIAYHEGDSRLFDGDKAWLSVGFHGKEIAILDGAARRVEVRSLLNDGFMVKPHPACPEQLIIGEVKHGGETCSTVYDVDMNLFMGSRSVPIQSMYRSPIRGDACAISIDGDKISVVNLNYNSKRDFRLPGKHKVKSVIDLVEMGDESLAFLLKIELPGDPNEGLMPRNCLGLLAERTLYLLDNSRKLEMDSLTTFTDPQQNIWLTGKLLDSGKKVYVPLLNNGEHVLQDGIRWDDAIAIEGEIRTVGGSRVTVLRLKENGSVGASDLDRDDSSEQQGHNQYFSSFVHNHGPGYDVLTAAAERAGGPMRPLLVRGDGTFDFELGREVLGSDSVKALALSGDAASPAVFGIVSRSTDSVSVVDLSNNREIAQLSDLMTRAGGGEYTLSVLSGENATYILARTRDNKIHTFAYNPQSGVSTELPFVEQGFEVAAVPFLMIGGKPYLSLQRTLFRDSGSVLVDLEKRASDSEAAKPI